jgi:broad specificity phosphatase PhoE
VTRIVLVRHGQAAAGFNADLDPGLSETGRQQAERAASALASLDTRHLLTSPLRRARETADPLASRWGVSPLVAPAFGEIPSPTDDLAERTAWLGSFMRGTWDGASPLLMSWRASVLRGLHALPDDAVVFSHFIAINVIVGEANNDRRVVCFHPDNASRTVVDVADGSVRVHELGHQADTVVR